MSPGESLRGRVWAEGFARPAGLRLVSEQTGAHTYGLRLNEAQGFLFQSVGNKLDHARCHRVEVVPRVTAVTGFEVRFEGDSG